LRFEASAFFAFLVAFYVMEDWDHPPDETAMTRRGYHHGVFLK
jgi:hypothetical protein